MPNEVLNSNHMSFLTFLLYVWKKIHKHFILQNIAYNYALCEKLYTPLTPILCTCTREMYIWKLWKNKYANSYSACRRWFIPFLKEYGSIYISFTCICANSCCATNFQIRRKNRLGIFYQLLWAWQMDGALVTCCTLYKGTGKTWAKAFHQVTIEKKYSWSMKAKILKRLYKTETLTLCIYHEISYVDNECSIIYQEAKLCII